MEHCYYYYYYIIIIIIIIIGSSCSSSIKVFCSSLGGSEGSSVRLFYAPYLLTCAYCWGVQKRRGEENGSVWMKR